MTYQLWKDRRFRPDTWRYIGEGEDVPPAGRIILPLDWWRSQRAACDESAAAIGVRLDPADGLTLSPEEVSQLKLLALEFPSFTDGRAFSVAALLRNRYGFQGVMRACGDVLADQVQLMERCGFDEFEIADPSTVRVLEMSLLPRQALFYQAGTGDAPAGEYSWRRVPALANPAASGQSGGKAMPEQTPILTAHWG